MQTYQAPIRDMQFVLHELHPAANQDPDLTDAILTEAGKFATGILLPLNAPGDEAGCTIENGVVRTPPGFPQAYRQFCEAGWTAVAARPEYGGQDLPEAVAKLIEEIMSAANMAFALYPGLTHGAYQAIESHATDDLKQQYLPKMVSGEWSGTMCLTEAHCGTDLGLLRTRALPNGDGSYAITGSKIFISAGDHDLTTNIIHLVLARLPNGPAGTKGISLFLVPKHLPNAVNDPGPRNGVTCTAIEHKMGIKASATCQLVFENATGWLIGEPHRGLPAMFTMMNSERLSVGIQGLAAAEAAYQSAVQYARDRTQGRAPGAPPAPGQPADAIIVHPDVRRMLMTIRAYTEGCRALSVWVARRLDDANLAQDPATRQDAEDFTALMTPLVKALFSDLGFETTSLAMQVYGGHGYIRDHGMEQYVRDARIAMIYEGTNGVQAMDLAARKLPAADGRLLRSFFTPVEAFLAANAGDPALAPFSLKLRHATDVLRQATDHVRGADPEEVGAAATDTLRLFGLVALAFMWTRAAKIAGQNLPTANGDACFYSAKLATARFYMDRILPQAGGLLASIQAGKSSMMSMDAEMF